MKKENKKIFDANEYNRNFSKENYKHYHLKVSKKDEDIIKKIESQKNKNKYIIDLIREQLKRTIKTIDIKAVLQNGKQYTIEDFQSIVFTEDEIVIFGEYQYEFQQKEIFSIHTIDI